MNILTTASGPVLQPLENLQDFLLHNAANLPRVFELSAARLLAQPGKNFTGSFDAQVGHNQRGFQVVEQGGIDALLAFRDFIEPVDKLRFSGGDSLLEPVKEACLLFRLSKECLNNNFLL